MFPPSEFGALALPCASCAAPAGHFPSLSPAVLFVRQVSDSGRESCLCSLDGLAQREWASLKAKADKGGGCVCHLSGLEHQGLLLAHPHQESPQGMGLLHGPWGIEKVSILRFLWESSSVISEVSEQTQLSLQLCGVKQSEPHKSEESPPLHSSQGYNWKPAVGSRTLKGGGGRFRSVLGLSPPLPVLQVRMGTPLRDRRPHTHTSPCHPGAGTCL